MEGTLMAIDSVKEFFIKKIIMPKVFRIDIPGYIIGKFYTTEGQHIFVRNLFLSESFFVELENLVNKNYGSEGLTKLYGIGKDFGYRFAALNRLPKGNIPLSIDLISNFFISLYAEDIIANIDSSKNKLSLYTKDLVVTRIKGGGFPITIGGSAGIWGYLLNNFENIESSVIKKNEKEYTIICSTKETLNSEGLHFFEHSQLSFNSDSNYKTFNSPPNRIFSGAFNVNKLMQTGLFSYEKGNLKISVSNFRYVPVEISLPFELEYAVNDEILFEAARKSFSELGTKIEKQANSYIFLANMLTALGYGLVTIVNTKGGIQLNFNGFPWYAGYERSKFPIIRGLIDGFLSGQLNIELEVSPVKTSFSENKLLLSITVIS